MFIARASQRRHIKEAGTPVHAVLVGNWEAHPPRRLVPMQGKVRKFSASTIPLIACYRAAFIGWQASDSLDASAGECRRARLRLLARGG